MSGTNVYAGGDFTTAGGVTVDHIAKWNGTGWSALGTGTNSAVNALAVRGTDVYAGGTFTTAGGVTANDIAKWDGTNWEALGSGVDKALLGRACVAENVLGDGGEVGFEHPGG